ncbi:DJ-1/PfpI family protein [Streptomyces sp. LBUM 1478]|uniref:DJ-1/PfpI family protein n=1 Tax=Streptomyces scabiei TaxID=1930 RepID=UPI0007C66860|nr:MULTISPECIES: DJ-1/PfpI family protein [Streptomyces]MBP5868750.1 DJ-1/PfpI family protein [Streptomyces sp. LBUM 1485]MBP5907286.1 DJ-1/PfpI family protein [Streptomyces sp. LBUM 1478]MBP5929856.1 DJ-1/PfpI family protein [Streptomyces sp. LBUM 1479]MBP5915326.1 DJ-1/PfpI family protein [Streptomyces sp. LBUM 1486]MDX2535730.1 DJ-1/PfpI family protein [Streptomyces scabiei]
MERRTFLQASAVSTGLTAAGAPLAAAASPSTASPLRVQILLYEGVEELDSIAPFDVLSIAATMGGAIRTTLVSTDKPTMVTASRGLRIEVPRGWSPQDADVLIVPGGMRHDQPGSGMHRLLADKAFIRRLAGVEAIMVGVCTGVMALSAAGFTRGRPATTHSDSRAALAAQGAKVVNARVVDDGDLVTTGGITSGLDGAVWLVERFLGAQFANQVETVLEYERRGTVWRNS